MQGQRLFLTLAKDHLHLKIKNLLFSRTTVILNKMFYVSF